MNIVLFEPEIPGNTGSISRTCAVTGARLHLIEPLGFDISEPAVRRAGLDYWDLLDLSVYSGLDDFFRRNSGVVPWLLTTKATRFYTDVRYEPETWLMFGKETAGLPQELLDQYPEKCLKIPMIFNPKARSLNLSNCASIVLYEALRQTNFALLSE